MEASSSSNSRNQWKYQVFLSFRGEDTRLNFTDHLYAALWRRGIITFRDDEELERGEVIKHELLQAIEQSLCSVVVLSKNYASSGWCLEELQRILECRKVLGRWVLPIFYGVDPSDVRHQRGSFAEAFRKHEEGSGEDKSKVQRWRDALSEIANLSGYDSKNQHEAEFIDEISTVLQTKLEPYLPLYFDDGLVGIDAKLKDIYPILDMGSSEVRFVGIWGMGGIGKTTLARLVFNIFCSQFDISCCLENIREKSTVDGLLDLQRKLLSNLEIKNLKIDNLDQGKARISHFLSQRKVLLLLDDVDDIRQLEYLARNRDWLGQGSRIIVTTRDMHLLESHEASFSMYEIGVLNRDESLELFCQKAFKRNQPKEGYEELSENLVRYCQGLPLALRVLGSHFCGRDVSIWKDAFRKMKRDPPKDILNTLRISFEGLDKYEKNIFLDIACFFKGWHIDRVMQILEICDFYPKIGIATLVEKSLLTCDGKIFEMHDLLQEMGMNIVIQKSNNEICKQSRLWFTKDVDEVLKKDMGTEFIEGIVLNMHDYKTCWGCEAFSNMRELRVLIIFHGLHLQLPDGLKCLSNSLKVLEWSECSLQSLPLGVKLENLVELKLRRSKIKQLWNGSQKFENLKFIDLSYSEDLIHTPNFSQVSNLESLILEGCSSLVEIHQFIGQLKKLVVLNLKDCINIKYLPSRLETICLKDLNLCGCSKVEKLLEFMENMKENKSMETLDLSETAISEVPSFICEFRNLKYLSVRGCRGPISKPWWKFWGYSFSMGFKLPPLSGLCMLRKLDASYCNLDGESIPDLSCLSSLKRLDLSGNNFVSLPPSCISNLTRLESLYISNCRKLQSLPMFPRSLTCVDADNCGPMEVLPETQMWKLMMPTEVCPWDLNYEMEVRMLMDEIPAWFENQKDYPSDWKFDEYYQDSITGDIPDCCLSSGLWGVVFCVVVEPPNNADLLKQRLSDGLCGKLRFPALGYNFPLSLSRYYQYIVFLGSRERSLVTKLKSDGSNGCQFQLYFGAVWITERDEHVNMSNISKRRLKISKCGWRVVCSHEVLQKATMTELDNVPFSNFNHSTPLAINEFEGQDAIVTNDDPNAEHNQIQRRRA